VRRSGAFLLVCGVALVAIAVGTSVWLTSTARHAMVGQLARAESVAASQRAAQVGAALDGARGRLAVGATLPAMARAVTEGDARLLEPGLRQASAAPGIVRMSITKGGSVLVTVPDGSLPAPGAPFSYSAGPGASHALLSVPVLAPGGEVIGAINAELDLSALVPQLVQPFDDQEGATTLATADGRVLVTNASANGGRVGSQELLDLVRARRPGTVTFRSSALGADRIATAAPVDGYPIVVVVGADAAAAGSPAAQLYHQLRSGLALAVGLAALVLAAAAVSVTRTRRGLLVARQIAEESARRDGLTGLLNRRALDDRLARLRGASGDIGVVLLDVDRLKEINDSYGHAVGDEALRQAASALLDRTRAGGDAYRFGGDEFLLLVEGVDEDGIAGIAGRVRASIEARDVLGLCRLTAAVGWGRGPAAAVDDVVALADQRMYEAKSALVPVRPGGRHGVGA
jgi:diguanylate cyclase (GGDEF)-like protein